MEMRRDILWCWCTCIVLVEVVPLCSPMLNYSIGLQSLYSGMNAEKAA